MDLDVLTGLFVAYMGITVFLLLVIASTLTILANKK